MQPKGPTFGTDCEHASHSGCRTLVDCWQQQTCRVHSPTPGHALAHRADSAQIHQNRETAGGCRRSCCVRLHEMLDAIEFKNPGSPQTASCGQPKDSVCLDAEGVLLGA